MNEHKWAFNKALLPFDYCRCMGNVDNLLCKTCLRSCPGHPYRQSCFVKSVDNEDGSCEYYTPAEWHEVLNQWTRDCVKEKDS